MKATGNIFRNELWGALALAGGLWLLNGCSNSGPAPANADEKAPARSLSKTNLVPNAASTNVVGWEANSFFENNVETGRDPFYPTSARRGSAKVSAHAKPRVEPVLVLKSIIGVAGRRYAGINDRTFAAGETASVRVPAGRLRVHCLEISEKSAVVTVEGELEPKILKLTQ